MKFVSLFAGIGGFDLGLERAGHTCVGQVEIDPYCTRVLEKHWPDVPKHDDVKTFRGDEFGPFDMLVGGYPCQPFSVAGKRAGEDDPRHLWPEVHRIIRKVRPAYVLLENVSGHLALGFGRVLGDLAESGYDAEWTSLAASGVGAPHGRERIFILAHPQSEHGNAWSDLGPSRIGGAPQSTRRLPSAPPPDRRRRARKWLEREPDVDRMVGRVPYRVDRLRALGNAVVPQVAEYLGNLLPKAAA